MRNRFGLMLMCVALAGCGKVMGSVDEEDTGAWDEDADGGPDPFDPNGDGGDGGHPLRPQ